MHIAIIMDGNGRWATARGLPRPAGHHAGANAVDAVVEAAVGGGVDVLTLYAFSSANWRRPREEVGALFSLFRRHLITQTPRCLEQSIRLNVIGRRDRLSPRLLDAIEHSESITARCAGMHLRLAVDYSAQAALVAACQRARPSDRVDRSRFAQCLAEAIHAVGPAPEVDLLIRTGGEKRLSDFLLWECAHAELYFTDCLWPDFGPAEFARALTDYAGRERRFGAVGAARPPAVRHG